MPDNQLIAITHELIQCQLCTDNLPLAPKPIFQLHKKAKILIAGQAPGKKAHDSNIPFDDPSGRRLREWLGLSESQFYNPELVAILPMAFCYPGKAKYGDAPPPKICADTWRIQILQQLPHIHFSVLLGAYAQQWHNPSQKKLTLTERVKNWELTWPKQISLPHPSPRNNIWLKKNPWFELEVVPALQRRINHITQFVAADSDENPVHWSAPY